MAHIFRSPLRFSFSSERHRQRNIVSSVQCTVPDKGAYRGIHGYIYFHGFRLEEGYAFTIGCRRSGILPQHCDTVTAGGNVR